ncbi:anthrone oxygenase family protein [Streptomyces sp. MS19]|uniref:anthrone oxygenase family protein n=1 Tax=Streptomyces sp. MS19 TaxID=3385972 RepID=UPI0039A09F79
MENVLAAGTTVIVGLLVGVEFAVAVFLNAIFGRLPGDAGLRGRIEGARILGFVMPFWYIGSVVLGSIVTWQSRGDGGTGAFGTATALLALSVLMSVTLLVPINSRVKRWTSESVPADWHQQLGRWDRFHYLRVAVLVAAFALLVAGIA